MDGMSTWNKYMYAKKAIKPTMGKSTVFQLNLGLGTLTGFSQTSAMTPQKIRSNYYVLSNSA
jgi:hypothetical protein